MSELFLMFSICDKTKIEMYSDFFESCQNEAPCFTSLGYGTAADDILGRLGLTSSEKMFSVTAVTDTVWRNIKRGLVNRFEIESPGTGVAFITPMSSVNGAKQLYFLLGGQEFAKGEESVLKDTKYELLMVISNIGYSDTVMSAAREAGAGGGTVLHAKGTGISGSEKFFGVTLASEREIVLVVTTKELKNGIMKSISEKAGVNTKAQAVVFSLPVTDVAGIRFPSNELDDMKSE